MKPQTTLTLEDLLKMEWPTPPEFNRFDITHGEYGFLLMVLFFNIFQSDNKQIITLYEREQQTDDLLPPGVMPGSHLKFSFLYQVSEALEENILKWIFQAPERWQRAYDLIYANGPTIYNKIHQNNFQSFLHDNFFRNPETSLEVNHLFENWKLNAQFRFQEINSTNRSIAL